MKFAPSSHKAPKTCVPTWPSLGQPARYGSMRHLRSTHPPARARARRLASSGISQRWRWNATRASKTARSCASIPWTAVCLLPGHRHAANQQSPQAPQRAGLHWRCGPLHRRRCRTAARPELPAPPIHRYCPGQAPQQLHVSQAREL